MFEIVSRLRWTGCDDVNRVVVASTGVVVWSWYRINRATAPCNLSTIWHKDKVHSIIVQLTAA
ncbi:hypothetical protein J6590_027763 [Homalodisca vitripennis]|nr:hypothetical protein J6590_027763 [Homalodisca vitripennis]